MIECEILCSGYDYFGSRVTVKITRDEIEGYAIAKLREKNKNPRMQVAKMVIVMEAKQ